MALQPEEFHWLAHLLWTFIRLEPPEGPRPRRLESLREHLRAILLVVGDNRSTGWIKSIWRAITIVVVSHRDGKDISSLANILHTTNIDEASMGVRQGCWSFWNLAYTTDVEYRRKINIEARRALVDISRYIPENEFCTTLLSNLLAEVDTFLANASLGLNAGTNVF